ncbi:hypothetical protein H8356DRAFT_1322044 [Neocallimastix lanati (nom. inval.)]|nr:hypothetical protein H8356DRAFT_1322044 [Neocallimastix sp. JGI-2020a]
MSSDLWANIHKVLGLIQPFDNFPGFPHKKFLQNIMIKYCPNCEPERITQVLSFNTFTGIYKHFGSYHMFIYILQNCNLSDVYALTKGLYWHRFEGKLGEVIREKSVNAEYSARPKKQQGHYLPMRSVVTTSIFGTHNGN